MTQFIEIEGEMVRVVERSIVSTARLADVMPRIENRPPISMFHPRSAIWTYWNEQDPTNKYVKFLCELPPALRSITKSGRRYRLAMPWTYFIFGFRTSEDGSRGEHWAMEEDRVFHTNQKVTSLDSRLWTAFLPNVYTDGRICFGSTGADVAVPLSDRVDTLVNGWYLSNFNNDVHANRPHPLPFNARLPLGWRAWVDATTRLGASAWTTFPEWSEPLIGGSAQSYLVRDLLADNIDRMAPLTFTDAIPELQIPATFGRTEEWIRTLDPVQIRRLFVAINNIATEDPEAMAPAETVPTFNIEEDGGERIA